MQLGMIGLGRMGADMVRRLARDGHACRIYDTRRSAVERVSGPRIAAAVSLAELVAALTPPRAVWLMVPAAAVDPALDQLTPLLSANDIVIDGGNSYYRDDLRRADMLQQRSIHYVDVGTSGGVAGLERGYCLMIGGAASAVKRLEPLFATLAPGRTTDAPPAPPPVGAKQAAGTASAPGTAEAGYLHCGPVGAGHFVKMVHNGIEYGVMAAYAEGLNLLRHANVGGQGQAQAHEADAETSPLRDPQYYRYELDLAKIAEVWRHGSVISSWLLDLTTAALREDANLSRYAGRVSDSGEGRWTLMAAVEAGVPASVMAAALFGRYQSRGHADYADKLLSAMRKQFGGHDETHAGA